MRHLITEPQDAFPYNPTNEDWDDFMAYCLECEQREEFEDANLELMAMDCPE